MSTDLISTIIVGAASAIGGGALTTWIAKLLITRFIEQNDKLHEANALTTKEVLDKLSTISTELAVIRTTLGQVTSIKEMVSQDHDTLIEIKTWNSKYKDDLAAQFGKIRQIEQNFEDVSRLISGLRREAVND